MKNILLIGGSSGIGYELTKKLESDNNVFVSTRNPDKFTGSNIPRDTKDQKKYFQNFVLKSKHKNYNRGDIIFWKGHVAIVLKKTQLIHANAFHMSVKVERIEIALKRINEQYVVIRL